MRTLTVFLTFVYSTGCCKLMDSSGLGSKLQRNASISIHLLSAHALFVEFTILRIHLVREISSSLRYPFSRVANRGYQPATWFLFTCCNYG